MRARSVVATLLASMVLVGCGDDEAPDRWVVCGGMNVDADEGLAEAQARLESQCAEQLRPQARAVRQVSRSDAFLPVRSAPPA